MIESLNQHRNGAHFNDITGPYLVLCLLQFHKKFYDWIFFAVEKPVPSILVVNVAFLDLNFVAVAIFEGLNLQICLRMVADNGPRPSNLKFLAVSQVG